MSSINSDAFQQMLLQLRKTFLEDMQEKLDRLDQLLVSMEKSGVDSGSFNEFYRIVHSLKGSGGTFGLHIITTICHQLEDLLNTTEGGAHYTPALITVSLDYVDLLRATLEQIHAGQTDFPQIEERLIALRRQLAKKQFTVLVVDDSKLLSQIYRQALAELPVQLVIMDDGLVQKNHSATQTPTKKPGTNRAFLWLQNQFTGNWVCPCDLHGGGFALRRNGDHRRRSRPP